LDAENQFITYAGGDSNEVTLFNVPEPTMAITWSMLIGLGLIVRQRSNDFFVIFVDVQLLEADDIGFQVRLI